LLSKKIKESKLEFVIEPYLRFEGKPGEQKTMFFQDPFGNSLEFKSFKSDDEIFKST
jgi:extradiol dioxygenase family protein